MKSSLGKITLKTKITMWLKDLPRSTASEFADRSQYIKVRHYTLGIFGALGFPLYGWVWGSLIPQHYETPILRGLLSIMWIAVILFEIWPDNLKKYWPAYWWLVSLTSLPLFFSYMLFMNGFSNAWAMSMLAELAILALLMDGKNLISHHIIGTSLGYSFYVLNTHQLGLWLSDTSPNMAELLAVSIFSISAAVAFNLSSLVTKTIRDKSTINVGHRVAHELRTPLRAIINYSQRVHERITSSDTKRNLSDLNMIKTESEHCLLSLELLLASAYSKPADIGESFVSLTKTIKKSITTTSRNPGHLKWFVLENNGDIFLKTSPTILRHVFDNLFTNSIYAVQKADLCENGKISITIDSKRCSIKIIDNGTGISKADENRIFEPYFTTKPTGTGLGLPYCRDIIQSLGGQLNIQPNGSSGSCFILKFPKNASHVLTLQEPVTNA